MRRSLRVFICKWEGVQNNGLKPKVNYRQDLLHIADLCLPYDIYVENHGDRKLTFSLYRTQAPPGAPVPGSPTCQVAEPGELGIAPVAAGEVTPSGAIDPSFGAAASP